MLLFFPPSPVRENFLKAHITSFTNEKYSLNQTAISFFSKSKFESYKIISTIHISFKFLFFDFVDANTPNRLNISISIFRFETNKSTKGASKLRRDLINAEIANLRDLLPLPQSTRQRLSQLQLMALVCVYVRKANYFQQGKYILINRRRRTQHDELFCAENILLKRNSNVKAENKSF